MRKIRIEVDPDAEEEIVIRCRRLDEEIMQLQDMIENSSARFTGEISLQIGDSKYFVPLKEILFFESSERQSAAHTNERIYDSDKKLYQLEEMLPPYFLRVSKSTILNLRMIAYLKKDLTGSCEVGFRNSPKKVYVSRMYAKAFLAKIEELRGNN